MRRLLFVVLCGLAVCAAGCGGAPSTPKVDKALEEKQNQAQKQVDGDERAWQKEQDKKK